MTIANQNSTNSYVATAGQTTFGYTFKILDKTHIEVFVNDVLKTIDTHYTVTGVEAAGGGNVVFGTGLVENDVVVLALNPPSTQLAAYPFNDKFPAATHEKALDKLTQLALVLKRKLPVVSKMINVTLNASQIAISLTSYGLPNTKFTIMVLPSWTTTVEEVFASRTTTNVTLIFGVPAPANAKINFVLLRELL